MSTKNDVFVLQRETAAAPFRARIGNKTLTFAHIGEVDQFALADLFADENISDLAFIRAVFQLALSDADFEALKAAKPSRAELSTLFDAYKGHSGTDEGESAASVD